jgi:hypothetical protein
MHAVLPLALDRDLLQTGPTRSFQPVFTEDFKIAADPQLNVELRTSPSVCKTLTSLWTNASNPNHSEYFKDHLRESLLTTNRESLPICAPARSSTTTAAPRVPPRARSSSVRWASVSSRLGRLSIVTLVAGTPIVTVVSCR